MLGVIFESMFVLMACMFVGFICRKKGIITDQVNAGLSALLIKVGLPCAIIIATQRPFSYSLLAESTLIFFVSFAIFLFGALCGFILGKFFKVGSETLMIWMFTLTFGNVGYMGFPIVLAVFGPEGLFLAAIQNVAFNFLVFTYGVKLMNKDTRSVSYANLFLRNIVIYATIIGFLMFAFSISLPSPIYKALDLIGGITTPLAMFIVGSMLAKGKLAQVFSGLRMYSVIFLKLILIPVLIYFILSPFIQSRLILNILVVLTAMPCGSIAVVFSEQYGRDSVQASKIVFVSTLLSVLTLPIFLYFFSK